MSNQHENPSYRGALVLLRTREMRQLRSEREALEICDKTFDACEKIFRYWISVTSRPPEEDAFPKDE